MKLVAAALLLFALPLGTILAIALGPWTYQYLGLPAAVVLAGVVATSLAVVSVLLEQEPDYARMLLRYSAAAMGFALVAMAVAFLLQPGYMDPLGPIQG